MNDEAMKRALDNKTILVTGGSGRLGDTLIASIEREGGKVIFTTPHIIQLQLEVLIKWSKT